MRSRIPDGRWSLSRTPPDNRLRNLINRLNPVWLGRIRPRSGWIGLPPAGALRAMLQRAGAAVGSDAFAASPPLLESDVRY
jgi:hypothetical protein